MLSAIFAFFESVPIFDKWMTLIFNGYALYTQQKESAEIDTAAKMSSDAKTSEDVKAAARASAKATADL